MGEKQTKTHLRRLIDSRKRSLQRVQVETRAVDLATATAQSCQETRNLYQVHEATRQEKAAPVLKFFNEITAEGGELLRAEIDVSWDGTAIHADFILDHPRQEYRLGIVFDRDGSRVTSNDSLNHPNISTIPNYISELSDWTDCLAHLRAKVLPQIAVLLAEAELALGTVRAMTREDGERLGKRWAVFSPPGSRKRFLREIDGVTAPAAWEIYEAAVGEAKACEADDREYAAFWGVGTRWQVDRLRAHFLEGFLNGAVEAIEGLRGQETSFE